MRIRLRKVEKYMCTYITGDFKKKRALRKIPHMVEIIDFLTNERVNPGLTPKMYTNIPICIINMLV